MVINLVGKLIALIFEASNHTKKKIMKLKPNRIEYFTVYDGAIYTDKAAAIAAGKSLHGAGLMCATYEHHYENGKLVEGKTRRIV